MTRSQALFHFACRLRMCSLLQMGRTGRAGVERLFEMFKSPELLSLSESECFEVIGEFSMHRVERRL